MNSGTNFYKKQSSKETKKKTKEKILDSNNIDNEGKIVNNKEDNLLNKKKKRAKEKEEEVEEEEINQNDKLEINQNMFNQYNFYPAYIPQQLEWQIQQLNKQNINFPSELYQNNFYYIQNQYPLFPNGSELLNPFLQDEKPFTDLNGHINNMYRRGIINNIIGAFFIEECKEKSKNMSNEEETINNRVNLKKEKKEKKDKISVNEDKNNELNKENYDKANKVKKKEYENKGNDKNDKGKLNENKLRKPTLIW